MTSSSWGRAPAARCALCQCGIDFVAASHLAKHPEFSWQKPLLRDMKSMPWTTITPQ
jgi:hypothetical protein